MEYSIKHLFKLREQARLGGGKERIENTELAQPFMAGIKRIQDKEEGH